MGLKDKGVKFLFFTVFSVLFSCNSVPAKKASLLQTRDTSLLIQALLDNNVLNDTLFEKQASQDLILFKNKNIPGEVAFTYKGNKVKIDSPDIDKKHLDIWHPRFIIKIDSLVVSDTSAQLFFYLPDVNQGVPTNWSRATKNESWKLGSWELEEY